MSWCSERQLGCRGYLWASLSCFLRSLGLLCTGSAHMGLALNSSAETRGLNVTNQHLTLNMHLWGKGCNNVPDSSTEMKKSITLPSPGFKKCLKIPSTWQMFNSFEEGEDRERETIFDINAQVSLKSSQTNVPLHVHFKLLLPYSGSSSCFYPSTHCGVTGKWGLLKKCMRQKKVNLNPGETELKR